MTKTFSKISFRPEFEKDLKRLLKRFSSLEDDLRIFETSQLPLYHKHKQDNNGIFHLKDLGIEHPQIFKAKKFACRSLRGRGALSGIRLTYAYDESADHIEFIEIYYKADQEKEDRERIKRIYRRKA